MENFDYKPNSHRSKTEQDSKPEERKKLDKVVRGGVTTKKKSGAAIFVDKLKEVGGNLVKDIFVPAIKKLFVDFVRNGAEEIAWGSSGRNRPRDISDKISYNNYSNYGGIRHDRMPEEPRNRARFDFDTIVLDSRADVEMVLARLDEVIDTYGFARVSDLYDLLGVSCDYTYNNYGWTNLSTAKSVPVRGGGYGFELPKAVPLR